MTPEDRKALDDLVMADRRCGFCGTEADLQALEDSSGWTCDKCREQALQNGQAAIDFLNRSDT